jgi:predicted metal-dependent hydrolase
VPAVRVGGTEIPYTVRRSDRARRLRLVVDPGGARIVAPRRATEAQIRDFVERKRAWLFEKTELVRERALEALPERFVSGAKVGFRGRRLRLRVEPGDVVGPVLRYATAFHVTVPRELEAAAREAEVRRAVVSWLSRRATEDARTFCDRHTPRLGASPRRVVLKAQKTLWGSCGRDGTIHLNWRLVAAPKPVFEYVVVHELCHLRERHHGPRFWELVGELLPDFEERREWLRRHGVALG